MTADRLDLSLGEIQAMATKAAHGHGMSWDLARDCGWAVSWLCARGVDGVRAAAAALKDVPGSACPVRTGTWAADRAGLLGTRTATETPLRGAVLIVPFAARIARLRGTTAGVLLPDGLWGSDGISLAPPPQPDLRMAEPVPVVLHLDIWITTLTTCQPRATPERADWAALCALADRTYAPATEASRLRGAGTGALTDSD